MLASTAAVVLLNTPSTDMSLVQRQKGERESKQESKKESKKEHAE